jgi:hypothetical protein
MNQAQKAGSADRARRAYGAARWLVTVAALAGCGSSSDALCSGGSCDDVPGAPFCEAAGDLAPCATDGGGLAGVCVDGACRVLAACAGGACPEGPRTVLGDTGQRECFGPSPGESDGTIVCPGTPGGADCAETDYCGEDAQYGWDASHAVAERFAVSLVAAEPVVTDGITKLVWQGCSKGQSGASCAGEGELGDWFDAESYCDALDWGGTQDWTLPDAWELQSIADYSTTGPAIDGTAFVNTPHHFPEDMNAWWSECVWSKSSYAGDESVVWTLLVNNGDVSSTSGNPWHNNDKAASGWPGCYVRCVRESAPRTVERLFLRDPSAAEPVVDDAATRLEWQGCSNGQSGNGCEGSAALIDWKSALAYCEGLSFGGRTDWRLPNVMELRSIVDQTRISAAIDPSLFPNTPRYDGAPGTSNNAGQYWSATGRWYHDFALYVDYNFGFSHFYVQSEGRHVRCVRDGGGAP